MRLFHQHIQIALRSEPVLAVKLSKIPRFDMINHKIVINNLEDYGIRGAGSE